MGDITKSPDLEVFLLHLFALGKMAVTILLVKALVTITASRNFKKIYENFSV